MGAVDPDKLSLADFTFSEKGQIVACPLDNRPATVKKRKRISIGFSLSDCESCPELSRCPVKKGKKHYFQRYSDKEIRIAKRRKHEQTEAFQNRYRWRAGVEATMSEYDRRTEVKHLRVRALQAVRYCATLKALDVNIFRAAAARAASMMPEEGLCWA